jgi:hypothetical protein
MTCPEGAFQAVILFRSEDVGIAEFFGQPVYDPPGLFVVQGPDGSRRCACYGNALVVVVIQQVEGEGIIGHDGEQRLGLVS